MGKRKRKIDEAVAVKINVLSNHYFDRFAELSAVMFEWGNYPDTFNERFTELTLFKNGVSVFFNDEVIGYLALPVALGGNFDVYNNPKIRRAYANNGYNNSSLNENNSVLIYNNYLCNTNIRYFKLMANRLAKLDCIIDINTNAQKTPILVKADENQRLTMEMLYENYDGDHPYIFGDKAINANQLQVLQTSAPYVADKLTELKNMIWNDVLTYLGISNVTFEKKERMLQDEITRSQGGTIASRYSRLEARRQACREINRMFGLNMTCNYREDYQFLVEDIINTDEESEVKK